MELFDDGVVALASKHGKEGQLQAAFRSVLGWSVEVADVDTDAYGTFTGDVQRVLSPRDTAVQKARAGAQALGLRRGIASEGTVGAHPSIPFLTAINELVAFVDLDNGYELVESVVNTNIHSFSEKWSTASHAEDVAIQADFPRHAVIVRTGGPSPVVVRKGVTSIDELNQAVDECRVLARESDVVIETDYRAMVCPSRQVVIEECAWKLATRLSTLCPRCSTLGWGIVDRERGLACRQCGHVNLHAVSADVEGCLGCDHRVARPREASSIDPALCDRCNP